MRPAVPPPPPRAQVPTLQPALISELPPLRMALEDKDVAFMDAPLLQTYMGKMWCASRRRRHHCFCVDDGACAC